MCCRSRLKASIIVLLFCLRLMSLGLDLCLVSTGEMKVMKWSLMSSIMEPLVMIESLQFIRIWSIRDGAEFWILVAQKLVNQKPELVMLVR